jgi:ankyrin repeat protein
MIRDVPELDLNLAYDEITPLMWAVHFGQTRLVQFFLQQPSIHINAQQPSTGLTALMFATRRGHRKIVQCLLRHPDIRPDILCHDGMSAMWMAILDKPNADWNMVDLFKY